MSISTIEAGTLLSDSLVWRSAAGWEVGLPMAGAVRDEVRVVRVV